MDDKRVAYVEDVVNELSDMIDKSFKTIIDNKKFTHLIGYLPITQMYSSHYES